MSLIQSARMSGHDPHANLKDVLTRLPTHKASLIEERLLFRWQPTDIRSDRQPRSPSAVNMGSPRA